MPAPDRLSPGQRVRLIHWLDGRRILGPLGMVEQIIDGRQFRGCRPWMAAWVAHALGPRVPAYLYELERIQ